MRHRSFFRDWSRSARSWHDCMPFAALRHAMGRHGHRRHGGGSPFWGGGGFGFGDDESMSRGRKFSSDDLQLLLLALIAQQPSHGYELIKALDARSSGYYSPSPGMVYPALTYLEELGYVTVHLEGNRKRYIIADPGRDYLEVNRERADLLLAKLQHIGRKMEMIRRFFAGGEGDDMSGGPAWLPEFNEARLALKQALYRRDNLPPDEQRRIAAILRRAVAEIEHKPEASQ
ncbi:MULTISPECIES: PadR family transcriptional regulator [Burkholderiaceae]|uniref:PadR family transcriptional regulator n=1 Tax=Burkholderiaceae TaxID=119060 RepID=UPI00095CDC82|nr:MULTISPECIES: PadR family transcriptional regulator [Burkholderiaceae]MCG1017926.1 PadR family transcriptional regulator [Mycetohabitans sp. B4]SIT80399.1 DNA-binding transcriptional regulator, PadR family [Burkholderia sp. b13]